MIKEGQTVWVKSGDDYIEGIVEEVGCEGRKKYYGISGFPNWKETKEVFEKKPRK